MILKDLSPQKRSPAVAVKTSGRPVSETYPMSAFTTLDRMWQSLGHQKEWAALSWMQMPIKAPNGKPTTLERLALANLPFYGKQAAFLHCGVDSGIGVAFLQSKPLRLTAVDQIPERIAASRAGLGSKRVNLQLADPGQVPLLAGGQDVVVDLGAALDDAHIQKRLATMAQVLKGGGTFVHGGIWPSDMVPSLVSAVSRLGFECDEICDLSDVICDARKDFPTHVPRQLVADFGGTISQWQDYFCSPASALHMGLRTGALAFVVLRARKLDRVEDPVDLSALGDRVARIGSVLKACQDTLAITKTWFPFGQPRLDCKVNVIAFPHAGAGASTFKFWHDAFPKDWGFCPVQLPGRENRINEDAILNLRHAANQIVSVLLPFCNRPLAFIGWSLGSKLAFEVGCILQSMGKAPPVVIFAGVCPAPHDLPPDLEKIVKDTSIKALLRRLGGTSETILDNQELVQIIQKSMNGDIEMARGYSSTAKIRCHIIGISTTEDSLVTFDQVDAWQDRSAISFEHKVLAGDHFLARQDSPDLFALVRAGVAVGFA